VALPPGRVRPSRAAKWFALLVTGRRDGATTRTAARSGLSAPKAAPKTAPKGPESNPHSQRQLIYSRAARDVRISCGGGPNYLDPESRSQRSQTPSRARGVERLIRPLLPNWADSRLGRFQDHRIRPLCHPPLLSPSFGPYRTDPELDLGVMPTHDVLLVGLRGGRPRIRQLGEGRLSL
jgi:hypothetical protein